METQTSTNRIARRKWIFRPGNLITAMHEPDSGKLLIFIHQKFLCKMNIIECKMIAFIKTYTVNFSHITHVAVMYKQQIIATATLKIN